LSALRLNAAFGEYDRTVPLRTGDVRAEGVQLEVSFHEPSDIFRRMCVDLEFDLSEMSMGAHCYLAGTGDSPFVGLPAFPSRAFRHAMVFVNAEAGIETPADLNGKRIGIREWGMTAVVWIIGILGEHHGFDLRSAAWVAAQPPRVPIPMPAGTAMRIAGPGRQLGEMLEAGEIDAALLLEAPACMGRGSRKVRRLFPDYAAEERAYFQRTGIHPIMHTVVLRRDRHRQHPWLAASLYRALCEAREHARRHLEDTGVLSAMVPFLAAYMDDTRALFGDDYWPYGIEANRPTLQCLLRYAHQQALTPRQLEIEELFVDARGLTP
jgi:4,5-dihydroxyphthalate decarboxylase